MGSRSATGCWMCGAEAARDLLCAGCVREVEPELLDASLDVATDEIIDALTSAPDGREEAAVRAQIEEILTGFGIRRGS